MTQSMTATPISGPAFEPQGDFPPIDRGRQTTTNALPASRVYAQHQSAIDYSQVKFRKCLHIQLNLTPETTTHFNRITTT